MADPTKQELQDALDEASKTIAKQEKNIETLEAKLEQLGVADEQYGPVFGPGAVPIESR